VRTIGVALLCLLGVACSRTPDDEAIRAAITAGAQAAAERRGSELLDLASEDFIGNDELDRKQLANLVRAQLLGAGTIGVTIGAIDVDVQGDRAMARFDARVTDSSGRWIADRAATLHFETGWRREGRAWRCYNAKWTQD